MTRLPAPIAVLDFETTGLFPWRTDRVLEIAAVVIGVSGEIEREFVTIVNPNRDIGPSRIHGLCGYDIVGAPSFADIAGRLLRELEGTVAIAAHNAAFERQFLETELLRLGHSLPECEFLCTMELGWGGSLASCCADYGIPLTGELHHALTDARASAVLLLHLLQDNPRVLSALARLAPIKWPVVTLTDVQPLSRSQTLRARREPPTYLQGLLSLSRSALTEPAGVFAYRTLLERVLEDRHIDSSEGDALIEMARRWGLSIEDVRNVHQEYLEQLVAAALTDGVVTNAEMRDLEVVAHLLGIPSSDLSHMLEDRRTDEAVERCPSTSKLCSESETLIGKRVCFTGEMLCTYQGRPMSRALCEELATAAGVDVVDSVTKKLDILVVADPLTQSGKAKKARQYKVRVLHERVFWKGLGVVVG